MSFLHSILDPFLKWTASTEAECQAFRKFPHDVRYRLYASTDEADCIAIYNDLKPGFPDDGMDGFLQSLRRPGNGFIVAERAGRVVGMGGISLAGKDTAVMCYGLVSPDQQGQGIGTALALLRLCALKPGDLPPTVFIWTIQKPQTYYHRFGFGTYSEWEDSNGGKHPAAMLDLTDFRPEFTRGVLRRRHVVLEGELIPSLSGGVLIDKVELPDGSTGYRVPGDD